MPMKSPAARQRRITHAHYPPVRVAAGCLAGCLAVAGCVAPLPPTTPAAGAVAGPAAGDTAAADDTLYRQLGADAGIDAVVGVTVANILADPRLAPAFADTDPTDFSIQLRDQLCEAAGGPCRYRGRTMRAAHAGMDISDAQFDAVVDALRHALIARRVAPDARQRLLELLMPLRPQIVSPGGPQR